MFTDGAKHRDQDRVAASSRSPMKVTSFRLGDRARPTADHVVTKREEQRITADVSPPLRRQFGGAMG